MMRTSRRGGLAAGLAAALLATAGCQLLERRAPVLPDDAVLAEAYGEHRALVGAELRGNLAELRFEQRADQLRRGGSLWAKVGPYVYLFSPPTRELLERYPDLAAVRVVTVDVQGQEIARVTLLRDTLSDILWRRTLNILGHALQEGTQKPALLSDLVRWGERHTQYEYSPRYVSD
jgi:hypothetical protein